MRANGILYTEIAQKIGRTPSAVRAVINRDNWSPQQNIPLADREKGLTAKTCLKCELSKPLDDFYVSAPRGVERRWPYCKPCEVARLADRREKGLHLPKLRRHVAKHREKYPEQAEANRIFSQAIRNKRIIRPNACELCGTSPPPNRLGRSSIQGHHDDYSKPLEVRWFCQPCHIEHHRKRPNV